MLFRSIAFLPLVGFAIANGDMPVRAADGVQLAAIEQAVSPPAETAASGARRQSDAPRPVTEAAPEPEAGSEVVTIVIAGDTGLGSNMAPVRADGAMKSGTRIGWSDISRAVAPLLDGDINFANLETVVTDKNSIGAAGKTFNFRSHPAGVRHLVKLGINAFSTANNHTIDFGSAGMYETLRHLETMRGDGLLAYPGLGRNFDEAAAPSLIRLRHGRIAMSAMGIASNRAGEESAGQVHPFDVKRRRILAERIAAAAADYRIVSIHQGIERDTSVSATMKTIFRDELVREHGVDLVIGHHQHVPSGVEMTEGKVIFYGLGNFLHPGMQDMAKFDSCQDFGLVARIHLKRLVSGKLVARAIEAIPVTDMHMRPKPLDGNAGRQRIDALNSMANGLDNEASRSIGVRFQARENGTGLFCVPGAGRDPGRIGKLCRDWSPPGKVSARCRGGGSGVVARSSSSSRRVQAASPAKSNGLSSFFGFFNQ